MYKTFLETLLSGVLTIIQFPGVQPRSTGNQRAFDSREAKSLWSSRPLAGPPNIPLKVTSRAPKFGPDSPPPVWPGSPI
ncbi:hypothetical protein FA13DRAFT_691920 [Coprinellus micaceus]|uniref:Uncharacterized protein n=1 Tax=Coprinellus micaceus TaxID=71717 RepID=A0A4Y7T5A6_COPMI|nr:hypothetical protein FA13DRAFT_691920 [Coprinellus micaceus]